MHHARMLAVALAAALALALGTSGAAANLGFGVDGETTLTQVSRAVTFETGLAPVICEMTLTGTIETGIAKVEGSEVGRVTDVRPANCRGSGAVRRVRALLPLGLPTEGGHLDEMWEITYTSFSGSLPNPSELRLSIEQVQLLFELETILGNANCLYEGSIEGQLRVELSTLEKFETINGANTTSLHAAGLNSGLCPEQGTVAATGANAFASQQTTRLVLFDESRSRPLEFWPRSSRMRPEVRETTVELINEQLYFSLKLIGVISDPYVTGIFESRCRDNGGWLRPDGGWCRMRLRRNTERTLISTAYVRWDWRFSLGAIDTAHDIWLE